MALNAERFQREDLTQQFLSIFQDFEFCDTQQEIEAPSSSISVSSTSPAAETYQDLVCCFIVLLLFFFLCVCKPFLFFFFFFFFFHTSFKNKKRGYTTVWSDKATWRKCLMEELDYIKRITNICTQAQQYHHLIYTYRSCSKALANVQAPSEDRKGEVYAKEKTVLEGELEKVKKMMEFRDGAIDFICEVVKALRVRQEDKELSSLWSEGFLWHVFRLLDSMIVLDCLKNMKGCIVNDFAMLKRIDQFFAKENQEENIKFSLFLQQFSILRDLKTKIKNLFDKRDETFAVLINTALDWIEGEHTVLPHEHHSLLRCTALLYMLIDDETVDIQKSKVIRPSRVVTVVRKYPVTPMYGDMQCPLESIIKLSSWDEKVWGSADSSPLAHLDISHNKDYSLLHSLPDIRANYHAFMLRYKAAVGVIQHKKEETEASDRKDLVDALGEGVRMVAGWLRILGFQAAYKYSCPARDVPQETPEYERAVRRNYSIEECMAVVETIATAKSVAGLLVKHEGVLAPVVQTYIHDDLQELVHGPLRSMVRHAAKKQRKVRFDLFDFRLLGGDWDGGVEPNDPALLGQKPSKGESDTIKIRSRSSPPTATLWFLLRNMIYGLMAYRLVGKKTLYQEKDLGSNRAAQAMEEFYNRSSIYSYLLQLSSTLEKTVNTAHLWYREFYLALSDTTQFPIDMSLPWILTKAVVNHPPMLDYVLVPLDIYNDASMLALTSLRKRYLYDEIEAELNLAFDQFLFMLSDHTFTYFKTKASRQLLDNNFGHLWREYSKHKLQLEKEREEGTSRRIFGRKRHRLTDDIDIPATQIEAVLPQRHFQILGRSINICLLVTQRVNALLRKNFDYAINRFEASELCGIVELETLLTQTRHTHQLLSQHLELDDVDTLFREANQSLSATSLHSRIILHVISELVYDFLPNYNYCGATHRFIRAPISFVEEVQRPNRSAQPKFLFGSRGLNGAYAGLNAPYSKFLGAPHFQALLRVIGEPGLHLLASELITNLQLKLRNNIAPYLEEMGNAMPPGNTTSLSYDHGAHGTYVNWGAKLAPIIGYPELKTEVFQHFREFGNTLIFLYEMDLVLQEHRKSEFVVGSAFVNSTDPKKRPEGEPAPPPPLLKAVEDVFDVGPPHVRAPEIRESATFLARHADHLYNPAKSGSLFKRCMDGLEKLVVENQGLFSEGKRGAAGGGFGKMFGIREFHHVWSALMFVGNIPTTSTELATEELFGEGLYWGGLGIMYCAGQLGAYRVFDINSHILKVCLVVSCSLLVDR